MKLSLFVLFICIASAKRLIIIIHTICIVITCMHDSNALKFTPNGGDIQVKSSFTPDSSESSSSSSSSSGKPSSGRVHNDPAAGKRGKLYVEFFDTGPGISEVNLSLQLC